MEPESTIFWQKKLNSEYLNESFEPSENSQEARLKSVSRNLDTDDVDRIVKQMITFQHENLNTLQHRFENLQSDEANLEAKVEKKKADLERNQNRLKSMTSVR